MPPEPTVLLSVRPRFAEALLDGSKTVEVRRRRAHIADGSLCLLYATSPTRALVGAIRVQETEVADPETLWDRHGEATALDREEYDEYLVGANQPCAILVSSATRFATPVVLPELRRRHAAFVTPQSYRFLRDREAPSLLNGQLRQLDALAIATPTLFA